MISVIIPVYNRRQLLPEAVRSVLLQSYGDLELLVLDDGSTDGTPESLEPFLSDPRLRFFQLEHSGMPGAVRNRGVEWARGEWIAFLDSDDIWLPEKLKMQTEQLESEAKQGIVRPLIHGREIWLRGNKVISQKGQRHRRSGDIFSDALVKCIIGPSTVLLRRDLYLSLGGFREDMDIVEDYELWLRICALHEVSYLEEPCIVKRAGSWDQLSGRYGQIEKFRIAALADLYKRGWFSAGPRSQEALLELKRKCAIYARGCEKHGRPEEAARCLQFADALSED